MVKAKNTAGLIMDDQQIVIIGAGISGLATALFLKNMGIDAKVLEASNTCGGMIQTVNKEGISYDFAASSTMDKNKQVRALFHLADCELVEASASASKRYILKNNCLNGLKGPLSFIFTPLLSWNGKFRILKEYFIKPKLDGCDESVADFVKRRFGQELLDYALNPVIAGVFAGKPEDLSMQAAYPSMLEKEINQGSVMKGSIAWVMQQRKEKADKPSRKIISPKGGMFNLCRSISQKINDNITYNITVTQIQKENDHYLLSYTENGVPGEIRAKRVISTIPAFRLASLVQKMEYSPSNELCKVYYPSVIALNLIYNKKDIQRKLDSFGYLIPEKEQKSYLGAIWTGILFPDRICDNERMLFTLFIGGAREKNILACDVQERINKVICEFSETMRINTAPLICDFKVHEQAIPQYNLGYQEILQAIRSFEHHHPGFTVSGNYVQGNSVSACIENAHRIAEEISGVK